MCWNRVWRNNSAAVQAVKPHTTQLRLSLGEGIVLALVPITVDDDDDDAARAMSGVEARWPLLWAKSHVLLIEK
jgi:hypothetical protein